jgi:thioredoxin reductase (NADPH)
MTETYDVLILGAGPAGMSAGVYTGRARLKTLILEKALPGGQILTTDFVENYPGFPEGIVPFELMENFRRHAEKFGARFETDEAKAVWREGNLWVVSGDVREYRARALIIATGSAYKHLDLPNEDRLTGRGVSYCATCDGAFFRDRPIAVVGGGDNALTEANFLTKFASRVYLIHRRDQFRATKILQDRIRTNAKIEPVMESVIVALKGEDQLEGLTLKNVKDGSLRDLAVDGLFVSVGMVPSTDFVRAFVQVNEWGQIKVNVRMEAGPPGLFAAGDCCDACPQQMATAVGTGVTAALAVDAYLQNLGLESGA